MKILLLNRDETSHIGGDMVQVRGYMKALEKLGHQVAYRSDLDFDVTGQYDEAWLFHINFGWTNRQWASVVNSGIPYRVFAIYYPGIYSDTSHEWMQKILEGAKAVYSLSNNEDDELHAEFPDIQTTIIDNGVDKTIFHTDDLVKDIDVMTSGRYEEGKGQYFVVKACNRLDLKCVTAGTLGSQAYKTLCESVKNEQSEVLGYLTQEELASYLRRTKVFVCSSFSERNNLAILEAAACGCFVIDSIHNRASLHRVWERLDPADPADPDALDSAIVFGIQSKLNYASNIQDWSDIVTTILES